MNLNNLRDAIYEDAVAHGLWEDEDGIDWYQECHSMIECEVDELYDAIEDRVNGHGDEHFTEELADVIIMSLSVAGKLGIDIDADVRRKMEINKGRPWKHGKNFSARVNLISGKGINVQTGGGGCITAGSAGSTKKQILPEGGGGKL